MVSARRSGTVHDGRVHLQWAGGDECDGTLIEYRVIVELHARVNEAGIRERAAPRERRPWFEFFGQSFYQRRREVHFSPPPPCRLFYSVIEDKDVVSLDVLLAP